MLHQFIDRLKIALLDAETHLAASKIAAGNVFWKTGDGITIAADSCGEPRSSYVLQVTPQSTKRLMGLFGLDGIDEAASRISAPAHMSELLRG